MYFYEKKKEFNGIKIFIIAFKYFINVNGEICNSRSKHDWPEKSSEPAL